MKSHLNLKIFLLIISNDVVDTIAQLVMKKGLNDSSLLVWAGILIYVLNFFIWIVILYKVDLSIAMPVGSSSYILVPLAAIFFLHEHVDLIRWIGIACIVLGVYFVSQSKKPAEKGLQP
ncbi:MAG: EamA family transporter [Candidatus Omnitrophica bacterium]|nr:EamA family transporter [Candidatus Omnitrophota bacterium]MDD5310518.1 EamA family transporter [Candidatus Omnitrophota bacterium]MDD5546056.1 EamA family transporter [Candidatus Omnitrophota bacterium]